MHDLRNVMSTKRHVGNFLCALLILVACGAGCRSLPAKEDAVAEKAAVPKQITGIMVSGSRSADSTALDRLIISGNTELQYTSVKKNQPVGVVLYFPQTSLADIQAETQPNSNIIASIKTYQQPDQNNARIEIDLKKDAEYTVERKGPDLEVLFNAIAAASVSNPIMENEIGVEQIDEQSGAMLSEAQPILALEEEPVALAQIIPAQQSPQKQQAPLAKSGRPAVIDRIDFSSQESGKSAVIIGTTEPVEFDISKVSDRTLRIRLFNSKLPQFRRNRPLITTRFESAVDRVSPVQTSEKENITDIIIELRETVPYRPIQDGTDITVYFDPSSIGPRPLEAANLPDWQQVLNKAETVDEIPTASTSDAQVTDIQAVSDDPYAKLVMARKDYKGQKIALDFYKTDIKNVFRILQQISGKNYAIDKNVNGEVTISLDKPVPWDQVLDLVCRMNQLGTIPEGDIIRVATLSTIKNEEKARQEQIKAMKEREEQEKTLEPLFTEFIEISYANADKEIVSHLSDIKTPRGKITVDKRNNQLIITDTQDAIQKAKQVIEKIDTVPMQVQIEARIVEVNDDYTRELGFQWGASGEEIYSNDLGGQYGYNLVMNTPYKGNNDSTGLLAFNFERLDAWGTPFVLDAALRAMEQQGKGKIISSPKILTLDNQSAMIKQGLRVPYQTVEDNEVNIAFEDVDLLLEVTPQVTADRRISLNITTTKNEIVGEAPSGDLITSTNEAQTRLLVDDGDTIVIGGVVKTTLQESESGFPVLKDMPIVGWLFKSVSKENTKNELLIFITPRIVQLEQKNLVQVETR